MKIGVLGGGQLAQMLAQAGKGLGMSFKFICPDPDACAAPYGELICKDYLDSSAHDELIEWADVITYEFENIPNETVQALEKRIPLHPSAHALATAGDRVLEKTMFNSLGIPTAQFAQIDNLSDLEKAIDEIGVPSILKTRTEGYDGKGQVVLRNQNQVSDAWDALQQVPCILESMVEFDREVSIIASRKKNGDTVFFPLTQNHHREGILRLSTCFGNEALQARAEDLIQKITNHLNYVGTIALELFEADGELLANEIAPRVHNSGHWTQDGTNASQFENHLRAVADLDLIQPELIAPTAMVNVIATLPDSARIDALETAKSHIYGKAERAGRKIAHINLVQQGNNEDGFKRDVAQALDAVGEDELKRLFS